MSKLRRNLVMQYLNIKYIYPEDVKNIISDIIFEGSKLILTEKHFINNVNKKGGTFQKGVIWHLINQYTKSEENRDNDLEQTKIKTKSTCGKYISDIEEDGNSLSIKTQDGDIKVGKLSEILIEDQDRLGSKDRAGCCHIDNTCVAIRLDDDSVVSTGKVNGATKIDRYLHSWVEMSVDNEVICLDYTCNAIINKSAYYLLREIDEEKVTKISRDKIISDINLIDHYTCDLTHLMKEYLTGHEDRAKKLYDFAIKNDKIDDQKNEDCNEFIK